MADVTYIIVPAIFSRECPRHATYRADLASMVADEAMPQVMSRMIVVRMAVARFESMARTPTLANIALRAAKRADRMA